MTPEAQQGARKRGGGLRLAVLALGVVLVVAGGVLLLAGPMLFRFGVVDLEGARRGVQDAAMWSMVGGLACGLVGLGLSVLGKTHRAGIVAVLLMIAAGMSGGSLYARKVSLSALPPLTDVQTDWSRPVAFTEATLAARADAKAIRVRDDAVIPPDNGAWSGRSFAEVQREVYSDIAPLKAVRGSVAEGVAAAVKAAQRMGWTVMVNDPKGGVVEALYNTAWYGVAHDVAVRVQREGAGLRIDVRAVSRIDGHDLGENAAQVKQLVNEMALQLP